jgi:hypothetical protein
MRWLAKTQRARNIYAAGPYTVAQPPGTGSVVEAPHWGDPFLRGNMIRTRPQARGTKLLADDDLSRKVGGAGTAIAGGEAGPSRAVIGAIDVIALGGSAGAVRPRT